MQKAPLLKGSGLKPLDESKNSEREITHVFGKNLEERVVTNEDDNNETATSQNQAQTIPSEQAIKNKEDDIDSIKKRKFDAITGEENEDTVFQGYFKLFVWDLVTSNWIEKGRGQLKLNDSRDDSEHKSRLIMRVGGTLKIILNVALRHSFFKVIANSENSIRFTDSQHLWAASGSNANHLRELIEERLELIAEDTAFREGASSDDDKSDELSKSNVDEDKAVKRTRIDEENELEASKKKCDSEKDNNHDAAHKKLKSDDQEPSEPDSEPEEETHKSNKSISARDSLNAKLAFVRDAENSKQSSSNDSKSDD